MRLVGDRLGEEGRLEDLHDVGAFVTEALREELVQGRAEQVDVGALVDGGGEEHLGGHVRGRPCDAVAERRALRRRDAPVDEVDLAVAADHHVLGLDVAMNDVATVRELDGPTDLREDLEVRGEAIELACEGRPERMRVVVDERRPIDALDALHDEERPAAVVDAERVHGNDAGMLERPGEARLAEQADGGGGRGALLERLDGDVAIERALPREVNAPHPALTDGGYDGEIGAAYRRGLAVLVFVEIDRDFRERRVARRRLDGLGVTGDRARVADGQLWRERPSEGERGDAALEDVVVGLHEGRIVL